MRNDEKVEKLVVGGWVVGIPREEGSNVMISLMGGISEHSFSSLIISPSNPDFRKCFNPHTQNLHINE